MSSSIRPKPTQTLKAKKLLSRTHKSPKNSAKQNPKRTPKRPKGARWFLGAVLLVAVVVFAAMLHFTLNYPKKSAATVLNVRSGDTYQKLLVNEDWQAHPLSSAFLARAYLKLTAKKPLHTGAYQLPANASFRQAAQILYQGADVAMVRIQIIEGKTVKDLYHILKNTDGVQLELLSPAKADYTWADVAVDNQTVGKALGISSTNDNLEGQFAPDTYFYARGTTDAKILGDLHRVQKKRIDTAWQERDQNLPYKNAYELLIMASIIEKETGEAAERGKVAAVFINRMNLGMRLQTDPTIIYGLFDRYDGKIYRSNIQEKTDYNTYQIDGLPPTPIALPSAAAIHAAAHPEDSDVLYFVATGKGGHTFSRTLEEHNRAVAAYRRVVNGQ